MYLQKQVNFSHSKSTLYKKRLKNFTLYLLCMCKMLYICNIKIEQSITIKKQKRYGNCNDK